MLTRTATGFNLAAHRPYTCPTHYVRGILAATPDSVPNLFGAPRLPRRRLAFVDATVNKLYGHRIAALFERFDIEHDIVPIGPGEECKTPDSIAFMLDTLQRWEPHREVEEIEVWGGGAAHDGAGFACLQYDRGIPFNHKSTTLTGAVDVVFTYKVGAHLGNHRNGIGGYQPAAAGWFDYDFLDTNDRRELVQGMAEVIKIGVIRDASLFDLVYSTGWDVIADRFQGTTPALASAATTMVEQASEGMQLELVDQPFENMSNQRPSWWGHSFPLLELVGDDCRHGEIVALDSLLTIMLAWRREILRDRRVFDRLVNVYRLVNLPLWNRVLEQPGILDEALRVTTAHRWGEQQVPVPTGIGTPVEYLNDITSYELSAGLEALHNLAAVVPM